MRMSLLLRLMTTTELTTPFSTLKGIVRKARVKNVFADAVTKSSSEIAATRMMYLNRGATSREPVLSDVLVVKTEMLTPSSVMVLIFSSTEMHQDKVPAILHIG
jgi:hypothetical protein